MHEPVDLDQEEARLKEAKAVAALAKLLEVRLAYKDLRGVRDQWGGTKLCSARVNEEVTTLEIVHAPPDRVGAVRVEAWAYYSFGDVRIYSDPPCFKVAVLNPLGFGNLPEQDWDEVMRGARISSEVIWKVKEYLRRHPPIDYEPTYGKSDVPGGEG